MKYRVEVGAFITVISSRKIVVSANSPEEAAKKAKDRFYKLKMQSNVVNDVGDINVDFIEELENE